MGQQIALVLGGAASGKSRWAEAYTASLASKLIYVATAQAYDSEMENKIAVHQDARSDRWTTHEEPFNVAELITTLPAKHAVLIDCATMWLSNQLLAEKNLDDAYDAWISAMPAAASPIVIVSNEVGHGIVPQNALGRQFRDAQGQLNQRLAAAADLVVMVTAGLPMVLKGQLAESRL
ncbi:MAG: bifunctional adenosylcobinamide kinase/adenosylcobinamide-phosphate guanylyltransferase [Paracoccaceae bacterium]|nr:bifunctional adenosylcobinamide kinase/adenosylcobinamide-phosphate guanylyltransferase [Paracoccaceae bacterium]